MGIDLRKFLPSVDDLNRWAQGVKSGAITLLAAGTASITGIGAFNALTSNFVTVEPIKIPAPFEEQGFNSEIATARLLDEIATFQLRQTSSAKERVSILSRGQSDDLQKLQVSSVGGIDVKHIQGMIQDALGIQQRKITGEITFKKEGDSISYNVRLRKLPGNQVLLDLKTQGEPQAVLKKTAMAMIEVFDPHIAASIYFRAKDEENALRMIEVVLSDENPKNHKYSLNLRGYINIIHQRYDAAKADFDQIMALDPKFAPAYTMAAWMHLDKKEYDRSLVQAEKAIEYAPEKWWGYLSKARLLRETKRLDEAAIYFSKVVKMKPDAPNPYLQAGQFFVATGRLSEAANAYRKGLLSYPESGTLHSGYGELLSKQGDLASAEKEYKKALEIDPTNAPALASLYALKAKGGDQKGLLEIRRAIEAVVKDPKDISPQGKAQLEAILASK